MKSKQIAALLLAMVLLLNVWLPGYAAAAEPESSDNNDTVPVEAWTYTPGTQASCTPVTLLSDGSDSDESSADIVKVYVNAEDRTTGETVAVTDANADLEVNLYVGSTLISSNKDEDLDGMVEVSLAGLSIEERQNATISANAVVSQGKAIDGTARDDLFEHFPTSDFDGDGVQEYYRYTMELHSETIDANGNWLGEKVPEGTESNKVDIVFVIDATGSMSGEINNVKSNIASFAENLIESGGLDIRFCIIDYRDITISGEDTNVHTVSGSHWLTDTDDVVSELESIDATGGGDGPETVMDPLGYVADNSLMSWRSDAYRFAFVLTDADYKTNNNYGYTSMSSLISKLAQMEVVTSVITSSSYQSTYASLYETTGGIYADINSSAFNAEMLALSDSIIESVTREMTLTLSEPRLLVNMSVCYLADDSTSQSDSYRESMKNMLNAYAIQLAESTDGHILLDKVLLFTTDNRVNFYFEEDETPNIAAMADIQIQGDENDPNNVQIRNNAHVFGFFTSERDPVGSNYLSNFRNLPNASELNGKNTFSRILSASTDINAKNFITDIGSYASTQVHETGHYVMGFRDEYQRGDGADWRNVGGKPYSENYGLMDSQYISIELSTNGIEYAYMDDNFAGANVLQHTEHSYTRMGSCEDTLASWLSDPNYDDTYDILDNAACDFDLGDYAITYTRVSGTTHRTAKYSYAALSDSDFLSPNLGTSSRSAVLYSDGTETTDPVYSGDALAEAAFTSGEETVTVTVSGDVSVGYMKAGDEAYTTVPLTGGSAELPIAKGELAEVRITATSGGETRYNSYYVDRSADTDTGYLYTSADNAVMAYVLTDTTSSYTFIADNTGYTNGDYVSVNQATRITSDNGVGFTSGEIYSVASYLAEIDYTTLSWFKYADGTWTALDTDWSEEEETMNIGARADLDGEGLYVLMAKTNTSTGALAAENLAYTQSTEVDALVTLTFDDPNTTSKYYNVYYSESAFTDKNAEDVIVRSFDAGSTELVLNLLERGRTVYAAVEIVLEDGTRSPLSDIILIGGEADSDGDGIPDWYCDKYHLWPKDGEEKDIANSDDDGDGLTNLQEYQGGSDPTNPNDPVHTTNVSVESISVSPGAVELTVGSSATVTATVLPENATNKAVTWTSSDTSVATVSATAAGCVITAAGSGETTVYAVTADGGFSAAVKVNVVTSPGGSFGDDLTWLLEVDDGVLTISGTGDMPDYDNSMDVPWYPYRSRIRKVVVCDGVTSIGSFAFYCCENLTDADIADGVSRIGCYSFFCTALAELTLPACLTQIETAAFRSSGLTRITIPDMVTSIGAYAFRNCEALTEITFTGNAPVIGNKAFIRVVATAYYPADNATWTADVMQNYNGDITWTASGIVATGYSGYTTWTLDSDGTMTFTGSGNMRNYNGKTEMPWYAYSDQIRSVVIEEGVTSVGSFAFYGLKNLERISIAEGVTKIGAYAFKNCTELTSVKLPDTLLSLGDSAFYGCASLTEITIPAKVSALGAYCFSRDVGLTTITFEGNAPTVGNNAFSQVSATVCYPAENTTWTEEAVASCGSTSDDN